MNVRSWAVRFVLFAGGLFLSLVLLTFLAVQIQQRTLRWRAERLSAEMHQIRLYQSTWADAQRLMHRWERWGHYDGSCTAPSCKYEIEMDSVRPLQPPYSTPRLAGLAPPARRLNLYQWFGGRLSAFHASFMVHDGTIWRESTAMGVSVPRRRIRAGNDDDFDWSLTVSAESNQRLHNSRTPSVISNPRTNSPNILTTK